MWHPLRHGALCGMLLTSCCLAAGAPDASDALSLGVWVQTAQTPSGSTSRLKTTQHIRHGAFYLQDGEAGLATAAPGGSLSLGIANTALWWQGTEDGQNLAVARYALSLPRQGQVSAGWAQRIGGPRHDTLLIASFEQPLGALGRHALSLQGWASLADSARRTSLHHADTGSAWALEQGNLVLMVSHPLRGHWSLNAGIGSRWVADAGGGHTAGWQTLIGLVWDMQHTAPPGGGH